MRKQSEVLILSARLKSPPHITLKERRRYYLTQNPFRMTLSKRGTGTLLWPEGWHSYQQQPSADKAADGPTFKDLFRSML